MVTMWKNYTVLKIINEILNLEAISIAINNVSHKLNKTNGLHAILKKKK